MPQKRTQTANQSATDNPLVQAAVDQGEEQPAVEVKTRGQKAAETRARNKAAREKAALDNAERVTSMRCS